MLRHVDDVYASSMRLQTARYHRISSPVGARGAGVIPKIVYKHSQQGRIAIHVAIANLHYVRHTCRLFQRLRRTFQSPQRTTAKLSSYANPADHVLPYKARLTTNKTEHTRICCMSISVTYYELPQMRWTRSSACTRFCQVDV